MKITETNDGVMLEILVKPNSPRFRTVIDEDTVLVYCTQQPVKGRVNKELIKEFSRRLKSNVSIVKGLTSKSKILLIKGSEKSQIEKTLILNEF